MDSANYTRVKRKEIYELFPLGLTILAARPAMGKTTFATHIANTFCREGERTLYFCLEWDSKAIIDNFDHVEAGKYRCNIVDIPRISLEDVVYIANKDEFDVIIIDYVELMDFIKNLDGLKREDELRAMWMSLDRIAKKKGIRIIGISQLIRIRIDGSEEFLPDECLSYLDREFLTKRIRILHRPSYYSYNSHKENTMPISVITYDLDVSGIPHTNKIYSSMKYKELLESVSFVEIEPNSDN